MYQAAQDVLDDAPFGYMEHFDHTLLHPVAALILGGLILFALFSPKKLALLPLLAVVCLIPRAQQVSLAGLDFTFLRIMILVIGARVVLRGEYRGVRWRAPDLVMVLWACAYSAAYVAQWGTSGSVIFVAGKFFEGLGLWFAVRCLVRSWDDLRTFGVALAALAVVVGVAFAYEATAARNVFSVFGGVPETPIVREGRLRCQGPFPHPILAGCFWAALLPYIVSLWWWRSSLDRLAAVAGTVGSLVIIVACASSTPAVAVIVGLGAAGWFHFRRFTKLLLTVSVFGLTLLQLVMSRPVWFLLERIDVSGGSTGYHRALLLDRTVANFSEWAFFGVKSTEHWDAYGALKDVTNEFVLNGVRGGFLGFALFIVVVWMCFRRVGWLWRDAGANRARAIVAWALGVSLLCHAANFMAVSYFGQVTFASYFSLAVIVSLSETVPREVAGRRAVRAVPVLTRAAPPAEASSP